MKIRKVIKIMVFGLVALVVVIYGIDFWIKQSTKEAVYTSVKDIPFHKVGLLLGTGKYLSDGSINNYYLYRIDAAEALYKGGKVQYILVSGDNGTDNYNEPATMKEDLIARGIPEDKIYLDYAGFRTLDSVVRCREIFGQNDITVISQRFHNERAIYIAEQKNIQAIGYNAQDVTVSFGLKTRAREKLARCKMVLDLVFGKEPKFGGDKIEIP